jgi:hypothetical protein
VGQEGKLAAFGTPVPGSLRPEPCGAGARDIGLAAVSICAKRFRVAAAVAALTASLFAGIRPVLADCAIIGPPARLDGETVDWTLVIGSGQRCLRGLRHGAMLLDSVIIGAPAKLGVATVQGYGFSYRAPSDAKGEDAFSVTMAGSNRGIRGASTIRVRVLVR